MSFSTTYTLDKPYFYECFDESLPYSAQAKPKYVFLVLLVSLGLTAIYWLEKHYLGNFLIMAAVLECVAFYYRRPWWVTRQMLSRASGSEATLSIDKEGFKSVNPHKSYQLAWQDIDEVIFTPRGIILKSRRGMQYISNSVLNDEIIAYIKKRATK
ncbi:MAG TPA: YcxB family protein [Pseudoalteromonas prydzensis]|uniref:YcxB family protein n=2 Tax=Pseudoalteromonas prydzensis TaxID=182141 RepID=A0A7V1D011_9GAMM|nr:YcxB family protein [Pseudoalteromonas prydzensis]HEA17418.1 YcxB family protein [Pseudoalteromonas prydzensis]